MATDEKHSTGRVRKLVGQFTFKINGYSGLSTVVGASTESPEFDLCGHVWQLRIFAGGSLEAHKGYLSYYLASKSTRQARASYRLSVVNQGNPPDPSKDESFSSSGVRVFEAKGVQVDGWGRDKFMPSTTLQSAGNEFYVDDCVIFKVDITVFGDLEMCGFPVVSSGSSDQYSSLANSMYSLLLNDDSTDITLIVGEHKEKISAHRCILRARSPVFHAMLSTGGTRPVQFSKASKKAKSSHTYDSGIASSAHQEAKMATGSDGDDDAVATTTNGLDTFSSSTFKNNAAGRSEWMMSKAAADIANDLAHANIPSVQLPLQAVAPPVSGQSWWHPERNDTTNPYRGRDKNPRVEDAGAMFSFSNHDDSPAEERNGSSSSGDGGSVTSRTSSSAAEVYLEAPFEEGRNGEVIIPDVSAATMRELLLFIYTDACSSVNVLEKMSVDLFAAAAKYQISTLFSFVEDYLCLQIGPQSCLALLQLADSYEAPKLRHKALQVATENSADVMASEDFKLLDHSLKEAVEHCVDQSHLRSVSCCSNGLDSSSNSVISPAVTTETGDEEAVSRIRTCVIV